MNLIDRLQIAYQSQIGTVLVALLCFLSLLAVVYLILRSRQKQKDLLAFLHQSHYENAKLLMQHFIFQGNHKADFFGRQTLISYTENAPKNPYARCLIPPPNLSSDPMRDRFRSFHRTIEHQQLKVFAPYIWKNDIEAFILVQGNLVRQDGCPLPTFHHFLADKKLGEREKERVILQLAKGLSRLHELHTDMGDRLYHGFLLPRSVFADHDPTRSITQLVVADLGMAYALGPRQMLHLITTLREGKLPIEKYCANELLTQLSMLAPEQKSLKGLNKVGPPSDFYSFAALAVGMFSKKRFSEPKDVEWSAIPQKWQPFLKSCFSFNIEDRPKDFNEFEEWLEDPEFALTHHINFENSTTEAKLNIAPEVDVADLVNRFQNLKTAVEVSASNTFMSADAKSKFDLSFAAGVKSAKDLKWNQVRKHLKEALKHNMQHAEANVQLAIAYYELGDLKNAEAHYEIAKKNNPLVARAFREHVIFKT